MSGLKFKNIEELMDKLNNEYKVLLDVIDNVILVIDNEMKILFVNRKGRKLIGENVLMQPCKALKMDNCSTEKCCIMRYLHGLQPLDNLHKDGSVEKVTVSRFMITKTIRKVYYRSYRYNRIIKYEKGASNR